MPADKPTELSRIKLKTWTRQPVPMFSEHLAHWTPLPFGIRTWLWRYTCLLLLISMLWHRQAIFESKGDKLSSSAECRIRTHQGLRLHTHTHTWEAGMGLTKTCHEECRPNDLPGDVSSTVSIWNSMQRGVLGDIFQDCKRSSINGGELCLCVHESVHILQH